MLGVVVVSHGELAAGLVDSARFIIGDGIEQLVPCCLQKEDTTARFQDKVKEAIAKADKGDGVIILLDMAGGTTYRETVMVADNDTPIIGGVNLPLLMEVLIGRMGRKDNMESLMEKGRRSIIDVWQYLGEHVTSEE